MLFTELRFFLFFLLAFCVYWSLRTDRPRKVWLLLCSYVFYGAWDWRFLILLWASTILDYTVGRLLARATDPARRKLILLLSLAGNIGMLSFFKYYGFFVKSAAALLTWLGFTPHIPTLEIILPVGISFYTFQTLSYTIDVYRRKLGAERSLLDFAVFIAFFPQLIAGPITRAADFLPQLVEKRRWQDVQVRAHLSLFLIGFVKKACVGDNVALIVDRVHADPMAHTVLEKWLGAALYSLQIYCDFSGYSDMAIAGAGLLGYQLVQNFDFPFFAVSVTDFWRRWHMSLTSWMRDYVYIPLGGNRRGPARTYFNLVTVFFLCGLWHGANWSFVIWGILNGVFLMAERAASEHLGFDPLKPGWHRRIYTHVVWTLCMVVFRAGDLSAALSYLRGMFWSLPVSSDPAARIDPRWWLVLPAFGIVHWMMHEGWLRKRVAELSDPAYALGYGAAAALVLPFAATGYTPFIYFQF